MPEAIDQESLVKILSTVENKKLVQFDFDPYLFSLTLTFEDGNSIDISANATKQLNVEHIMNEDDGS